MITKEMKLNALLFPNQKGDIVFSQEARKHIVKQILEMSSFSEVENGR